VLKNTKKQAEPTQPKSSARWFEDEELKLLIENAANGDSFALEQLCESIVNYVMFRTSKIMFNHSDAEDVAQESLLRVCKNIQSLKDPTKFHSWLMSIIVNESRRKMKSNSKTAGVLNFEDELDSICEENDIYVPEAYYEIEEHRKDILDVIGCLSVRQRQAVMLHYFEDISVTETANIMGISQPNVTLYLQNARNKIKNELECKKGWSWNGGIANGFAMVPFGSLISNALVAESQVFQMNAAWVSETLAKCGEIALGIGLAGTTALAVEGGSAVAATAGSTAAMTSGTTAGATGAAATSSIAAVVGTCATIVAAVAISVGVATTTLLYTPEEPADRPPVSTYASAQIEFVGEDALSHINPTRAEKTSDSAYGALNVLHWSIRHADAEQPLYTGEGRIVEDVFDQMRYRGAYGVFYLEFLLEDALGAQYALGHNFIITE